jgi:hypothetical protein
VRSALALTLLVGTLSAAPVPKELKKPDDKELLVGTWMTTGSGTANFRFNADGTMQTWTGQDVGRPVLEWTWSDLDPMATPKRVKLTRAVGTASYDCLYELSGDSLKIAFIVDKTKPIPDKLQARPGFSVYELTREKPGK